MIRHFAVSLAFVITLAGLSSLQAAPVSYWNFDNQTANDVTTTGNHGILKGDAGFTSQQPAVLGSGYALTLDGNGDWVQVPDDASGGTLDAIGDTVTVSYWLKGLNTEQVWGWARTMSKMAGNAGWNFETISDVNPSNPSVNPSQFAVRIDTLPTNRTYTSRLTLLDGQWHQVALTLDRGKWTTYQDGALFASGTYTHGGGFATTRDFSLGSDLGARPFKGLLDDVAIWSEALGTAKTRSIYTVPTALGLAYDLGDMTTLWDIYDSQTAGGIAGIPWQFTSSLPALPGGGAAAPGDAYRDSNGIMYVALGDGLGLAAVPEPSTFLLAAVGLLGLAFFGRRQKRG